MNAKNKNNMKRHLHFYQWLLCLLLTMGCHLFAYSQGKVTCLEDLQAGDVIEIYPYGHYDEASKALSCNGDGMDLSFPVSSPGQDKPYFYKSVPRH